MGNTALGLFSMCGIQSSSEGGKCEVGLSRGWARKVPDRHGWLAKLSWVWQQWVRDVPCENHREADTWTLVPSPLSQIEGLIQQAREVGPRG